MIKYAKRLRDAVTESQDEENLPDYLAVQINEIADNIEQYAKVPELLAHLEFMVLDYNTYAETCCEKIGTSHFEIENMLAKIRERA